MPATERSHSHKMGEVAVIRRSTTSPTMLAPFQRSAAPTTLRSFYRLPVKFPPRVHWRVTGLCLSRERHGLSTDWLLEFFGF